MQVDLGLDSMDAMSLMQQLRQHYAIIRDAVIDFGMFTTVTVASLAAMLCGDGVSSNAHHLQPVCVLLACVRRATRRLTETHMPCKGAGIFEGIMQPVLVRVASSHILS